MAQKNKDKKISTIQFNIPGRHEDGYLDRSIKALGFKEKMQSRKKGDGPTVALLLEMISFLSVYVTVPEDQKEKEQALRMASEAQFDELMDLIVEGQGTDDEDDEETDEETEKEAGDSNVGE